jgi:uncharacterized protein YqcC (DUF446 family)
MQKTTHLSEKISEVILEMKANELWSRQAPAWVHEFSAITPVSAPDLRAWLQFVYLPNVRDEVYSYLQPTSIPVDVAPQAAKCLQGFSDYMRLLRLLVELDALQ